MVFILVIQLQFPTALDNVDNAQNLSPATLEEQRFWYTEQC